LASAELPVGDLNGDGRVNVLDVAIERGLSGGEASARGFMEAILFETPEITVAAGEQASLRVLFDSSEEPIFGYSLDVDVTALSGATGTLAPLAAASNFGGANNIIVGAGAMLDPLFSVIQGAPDGGLFVSANTSDGSVVESVPGVNDVFAEVVFEAPADAAGMFELSFGPGTAIADAAGQPIEFLRGTATIIVESAAGGVTRYEQGDLQGGNDVFDDREVFTASDPLCSYLSGKLEASEVDGRAPDTYLFLFDKDDNVVCEDDDSSTKGNGKASACFGVAPIADGDSDAATVRIGLTGRPDGVDGAFNGLFFNAAHGQLGEAEVCVTYFDDHGDVIDTDTYLARFVTGAEAFRINYVVPDRTALVDVEVDNTVERFEVGRDVDYYQIEGLEPLCDYAIGFVGGVTGDCSPTELTLGWFDKHGNRVDPVAEDGSLAVISDVNGRVRLAVSGARDGDFDGLIDEPTPPRNVGTPGVELPPVHGVIGCYTLKIDWNKHRPTAPSGRPLEGVALQMATGDVNLDGGVDIVDLAVVLNNWGWAAP
jgi:hypothetical protein